MKGAILLVDNDRDILAEFGALLEEDGYLVYRADDADTAQRLAQEQDVDIAVIDVRLRSEDDPRDTAGVELSASLPRSICRILHTAFARPNEREWVESLCFQGRADGYMRKDTSSEERLREIERCCREEVRLNPVVDIQLDDPLDWDQLGQVALESIRRVTPAIAELQNQLDALSASDLGGDLERLLRRLLPNSAVEASFEQNEPGRGGAGVLRATVVRGAAKLQEKVVVKFGAESIIRSEADRYERFVEPLPDEAAARLRWRASLQRLGAIAYSRVGAGEVNVPALDEVRGELEKERQRVLEIVRTLFETTCGVWYEAYREADDLPEPKRLRDDVYLGDRGLWYRHEDARQALRRAVDVAKMPINSLGSAFGDKNLTFKIGRSKWTLPNPVEAALAEDNDEAGITVDRLCVTHGDLHVRNVLVVRSTHPRLIDFGSTGESHVYRDFAALEASLRFSCIKCQNRRTLLRLEKAMLKAETLESTYDLGSIENKLPELAALAKLIREIRRLARDAAGEDDLESYLRALMYHCLKYAAADVLDEGEPNGRGPIRRWHALLTAALILDKLRNAS